MKHIAALAGGLFLHTFFAGCGSDAPAMPDSDPSASDASVRPSDASSGTAPIGSAAGEVAIDPGKLDLLLVVDNSYSMAREQEMLAAQLPRLLRILATGDRTPELPAGDPSDSTRYFTPVRSLHAGVVTTELAVMKSTVKGIERCTASPDGGDNDDARLQTTVDVASNGQVANSASTDNGIEVGDELFPARSECQGRELEEPNYLAFDADDGKDDATARDAGEAGLQLGCLATVGVYGCPFEQQLEAMWKAVAPSTTRDFLEGTAGQGNPSGANRGFVRDDATLAILLFSDEDDCSITDAGRVLFDTPFHLEPSEEWVDVPYNMRCARAEQQGRSDLLRSVDRYVDGLKSLKPGHPDQVLFAGLVGIPVQAEALLGLRRYDDVLALPAMQIETRDAYDTIPQPSCRVQRSASGPSEYALPARRIVQLAKGLGDGALLFSICRPDYQDAVSSLIELYVARRVQP